MSHTSTMRLSQLSLWDKITDKRALVKFDIELAARCSNDCRHCYICLPANDQRARSHEPTLTDIGRVADEAVQLGALWCLLTGGEPLLRPDFEDVYMLLKRKGLLVSVFTNATLVSHRHVELFATYPPRDLKITVYGVTPETYERVTRRPGSYAAFRRGLDLLLQGGIKVRLKAMAMRSNAHELPAIAAFCRAHTKDYFRFDFLLHLRYDGNPTRNEDIKAERLSAEQTVALEQGDSQRRQAMQDSCDSLVFAHTDGPVCDHLFRCGIGRSSFTLGYDGRLRLCSSLWPPATL